MADAALRLADAAIALRERCAALFDADDGRGAFGLGLDVGPVVGASLGDPPELFNLWGEVIHGAEALAASAPAEAIQASERAYLRLRRGFPLSPPRPVLPPPHRRGAQLCPGGPSVGRSGVIGAEVRGRFVLHATTRRPALGRAARGSASNDLAALRARRVSRQPRAERLATLGTIAATAFIVGLGLVFEALYWLKTAGEEQEIGRILVIVLIREITRSWLVSSYCRAGTAAVAELADDDGAR